MPTEFDVMNTLSIEVPTESFKVKDTVVVKESVSNITSDPALSQSWEQQEQRSSLFSKLTVPKKANNSRILGEADRSAQSIGLSMSNSRQFVDDIESTGVSSNAESHESATHAKSTKMTSPTVEARDEQEQPFSDDAAKDMCADKEDEERLETSVREDSLTLIDLTPSASEDAISADDSRLSPSSINLNTAGISSALVHALSQEQGFDEEESDEKKEKEEKKEDSETEEQRSSQGQTDEYRKRRFFELLHTMIQEKKQKTKDIQRRTGKSRGVMGDVSMKDIPGSNLPLKRAGDESVNGVSHEQAIATKDESLGLLRDSDGNRDTATEEDNDVNDDDTVSRMKSTEKPSFRGRTSGGMRRDIAEKKQLRSKKKAERKVKMFKKLYSLLKEQKQQETGHAVIQVENLKAEDLAKVIDPLCYTISTERKTPSNTRKTTEAQATCQNDRIDTDVNTEVEIEDTIADRDKVGEELESRVVEYEDNSVIEHIDSMESCRREHLVSLETPSSVTDPAFQSLPSPAHSSVTSPNHSSINSSSSDPIRGSNPPEDLLKEFNDGVFPLFNDAIEEPDEQGEHTDTPTPPDKDDLLYELNNDIKRKVREVKARSQSALPASWESFQSTMGGVFETVKQNATEVAHVIADGVVGEIPPPAKARMSESKPTNSPLFDGGSVASGQSSQSMPNETIEIVRAEAEGCSKDHTTVQCGNTNEDVVRAVTPEEPTPSRIGGDVPRKKKKRGIMKSIRSLMGRKQKPAARAARGASLSAIDEMACLPDNNSIHGTGSGSLRDESSVSQNRTPTPQSTLRSDGIETIAPIVEQSIGMPVVVKPINRRVRGKEEKAALMEFKRLAVTTPNASIENVEGSSKITSVTRVEASPVETQPTDDNITAIMTPDLPPGTSGTNEEGMTAKIGRFIMDYVGVSPLQNSHTHPAKEEKASGLSHTLPLSSANEHIHVKEEPTSEEPTERNIPIASHDTSSEPLDAAIRCVTMAKGGSTSCAAIPDLPTSTTDTPVEQPEESNRARSSTNDMDISDNKSIDTKKSVDTRKSVDTSTGNVSLGAKTMDSVKMRKKRSILKTFRDKLSSSASVKSSAASVDTPPVASAALPEDSSSHVPTLSVSGTSTSATASTNANGREVVFVVLDPSQPLNSQMLSQASLAMNQQGQLVTTHAGGAPLSTYSIDPITGQTQLAATPSMAAGVVSPHIGGSSSVFSNGMIAPVVGEQVPVVVPGELVETIQPIQRSKQRGNPPVAQQQRPKNRRRNRRSTRQSDESYHSDFSGDDTSVDSSTVMEGMDVNLSFRESHDSATRMEDDEISYVERRLVRRARAYVGRQEERGCCNATADVMDQYIQAMDPALQFMDDYVCGPLRCDYVRTRPPRGVRNNPPATKTKQRMERPSNTNK